MAYFFMEWTKELDEQLDKEEQLYKQQMKNDFEGLRINIGSTLNDIERLSRYLKEKGLLISYGEQYKALDVVESFLGELYDLEG